jgi:catechol 2,3-dioxygenase-like lactoylglutathione lyase family enzyme
MTRFQPPVPAFISRVGARFLGLSSEGSASPGERSEREVVGARHAVPVFAAAPRLGKMPTTGSLSSRAPKLSSRAQRGICFSPVLRFTTLLIFASVAAIAFAKPAKEPTRARLLGIAYVQLQVSDLQKAADFYSMALHAAPPSTNRTEQCNWCEIDAVALLKDAEKSPVHLEKAASPVPSNLLVNVAFWTDDASRLRDFLRSQHVAVEKMKNCGRDSCFSLLDPEQHRMTFVQVSHGGFEFGSSGLTLHAPPTPIIHAGFIVHDRAATEHFYKDILGFRPYWHGGMKDDQTDWVSMQVPDGTDWLEFMVNVSPDADQRVRGIMNHIAIGVTDIHATEQRLKDAGVNLTEQPKIGRDGKWQLNVYDPDQTRIEFMEFTPVQKPCCSDFTGPHPQP